MLFYSITCMKTVVSFSIRLLFAVYLLFTVHYTLASEWDIGEHVEEIDACDSVILHYDGKSWKTQKSGTNYFFSGIWGNRKDNMYVVGVNPAGLYDHLTQ